MAPVEPLHPDPRQRVVLDHADGAMLVSGGSGTGKTAVLRERFARLVEGGADPERVALVVGSRRARDEARRLLLERLPVALPNLTVVTIHGLAFHVVGERFERLGYATPPTVLSASEQFLRVRELLDGEDPRALAGLRLAARAPRVRRRGPSARDPGAGGAPVAGRHRARGGRARARGVGRARRVPPPLPVRARRLQRGRLRGARRAGLRRGGRGRSPVRPRDGRRLPGHDLRGRALPGRDPSAQLRRGRRPRRAPVLVPGNHRRTLPTVRRAQPGRRVGRARDPASSRARVDRGLACRTRLRAARGGRARAAPAPRRRRGRVARARGGRPAPRATRRRAPARPRRRARPTQDRRRGFAGRGPGHPPVRARPALAGRRSAGAGRADRAGPDLRARPAVAGVGPNVAAPRARARSTAARGARAARPRRTRGRGSAAGARGRPRTGRGRPRLGARCVPRALARAPVRSRPGGAGRDRPPRARRPRRGGRALGRRRVRGHGGRPVDRGLPALARRGGGCADPRGGRRGRPRRGAGADGARGRRSRVRHGDRARCARGRLPEPVPARADVRSRDARGRDRAFRGQPATARRRAPPVRDGPLARAAPGGADRDRSARRRVLGHADLAVRRGARSPVARRPGRAVRGAGVDVRGGLGVAARARRPERAGGRAARGPGRAARARGRPRCVVVPARVDRPVRGGGGRPLAVVLAAVDARELRAAVRAVQRARAGSGRRLPGLGGQARALDHRGVRARRGRAHARGVRTRPGRAVGEDPVPVVRDLRGRARERQDGPDPELVRTLRGAAGDGDRARVRVRVRGRSDPRQDRPDRPGARGRHADHRLQDRAFGQRTQARREPAARHLLPGGQRGRRAGRAPAGTGGRARVPRREEGGSRARRQGVVGLRGRRGGLQGADARAAHRADRPHPRAQRGAPVRRQHEGELLLLPVPDPLHALPAGRRRVPGRSARDRAGRGRLP